MSHVLLVAFYRTIEESFQMELTSPGIMVNISPTNCPPCSRHHFLIPFPFLPDNNHSSTQDHQYLKPLSLPCVSSSTTPHPHCLPFYSASASSYLQPPKFFTHSFLGRLTVGTGRMSYVCEYKEGNIVSGGMQIVKEDHKCKYCATIPYAMLSCQKK